jgi:hypothetical protein
MRIPDKCFRELHCPNIGSRMNCMHVLKELIMIKRAKNLERRIR